jgi:hypothetical protein
LRSEVFPNLAPVLLGAEVGDIELFGDVDEGITTRYHLGDYVALLGSFAVFDPHFERIA